MVFETETPPFLKAQNLSPYPFIRHGFFTRVGGVSKGPLATLNCGHKKQEPLTNLENNRTRIKKALQLDNTTMLVGLHQKHGSTCHTITKNTNHTLEGDGLVTRTAGLMLSILTADCGPVLFCDPVNKVIGAAHAGWRGAVGGILESTLHNMLSAGAELNHIKVALGPCIHQKSYEVGDDVTEHLSSQEKAMFLLPTDKKGKYFFDLPGLIMNTLRRSGIRNAISSPLDTYLQSSLFFSCRRNAHLNLETFGVQLSAIVLLPC